MTPDSRGLLVTGLPRSGTSWVGKMLEGSGEVVYVNEPMSPQRPPGLSPGVLDARVDGAYHYIDPADDAPWRRAFERTLGLDYQFRAELRRSWTLYELGRMVKYGSSFTVGRLRGRRAMIDDPFAVLSTGWLVEQMGMTAIVLVRDPVSVVGSWHRLGWRVNFHELLEQPALVRDHLGPYVDRMRALIGSPDWLARTCLLWEMVYDVVDRAFRPLPGVHVRSYEALVRDPLGGFAELYERCDLTWSPRAERLVRESTTDRPGGDRASHRWSLRGGLNRTAFRPMGAAAALSPTRSGLSEEEAERVRRLTAAVMARLLPPAGR